MRRRDLLRTFATLAAGVPGRLDAGKRFVARVEHVEPLIPGIDAWRYTVGVYPGRAA